ncbi:MAG: enoyl-CoA hydratase/isomerase family protein [Deltaproteobacteria bacterium]|nr:MAG: enoyl-CoA hydratase/isomerase family protein [Deltaproteobacteria bacterium]
MFEINKLDNAVEVILQRPPVNALSDAWILAFHQVLDVIEQMDALSVVHFRSGLELFSAGADLKEIEQRLTMPPEEMVRYNRSLHTLFNRIEDLDCVTLCEINGLAFGGGFELTLACDLRIAANEAMLGLPEARLGLIPGAGGTQRLTRIAGLGVANMIILGCEVVDGEEARRLGMVQWSCPKEDLPGKAREIRQRIAALAPPALSVSKRCIKAYLTDGTDGFEMEIEAQRELIVSDEAKSRVRAFVDERRKRSESKKAGTSG